MKKNTLPKRYKIAEVAIEINESGKVMFWCNNIGYHAQQGGMEFGWGNFGTADLKQTLDILNKKLEDSMPEILGQIKRNKS